MGLPEQDQPPEHIWLNAEAVHEHFEQVRERYRSGSGGSSDDSQQNEYTRGLR